MALTDKLSAIGDAIRAKTGKSEKIPLDQMPDEIASIETGGGSGGEVGGLSQYIKFTATPQAVNLFTITNPLGGLAKKVSIACPTGSAPETTNGFIQKYTMDATVRIGAMYYLHATNGSVACTGARQEVSATANARYAISEGQIAARSYASSNGMWDTTCEYEIEIWQ